jgi:phosphatidylglycerophosphate synthase
MQASTLSPSPSRRWLTRANALSALRLVIAPGLAAAIGAQHRFAAAALLLLAIATDFADGAVARRYGEASPFGGLVDHATDATLVVLGLSALASRGELPRALAPLVAAAFAQYALDSRTLAGRALRASRLGRWNGIAYYVLVSVPVFRDALGLSWPGIAWMRPAGWLFVASTLVSMLDRLAALLRRGAAQLPRG